MLIGKILDILGESKDITKLSADTTSGKTGKGADSIAAGTASPYKKKKGTGSPFDKKFPAVAELVKKVKDDSFNGDRVVTGAALAQLTNLVETMPLNADENGQLILPFGNNIRLKQKGQAYYIGVKEEAGKEDESDLLAAAIEDSKS